MFNVHYHGYLARNTLFHRELHKNKPTDVAGIIKFLIQLSLSITFLSILPTTLSRLMPHTVSFCPVSDTVSVPLSRSAACSNDRQCTSAVPRSSHVFPLSCNQTIAFNHVRTSLFYIKTMDLMDSHHKWPTSNFNVKTFRLSQLLVACSQNSSNAAE